MQLWRGGGAGQASAWTPSCWSRPHGLPPALHGQRCVSCAARVGPGGGLQAARTKGHNNRSLVACCTQPELGQCPGTPLALRRRGSNIRARAASFQPQSSVCRCLRQLRQDLFYSLCCAAGPCPRVTSRRRPLPLLDLCTCSLGTVCWQALDRESGTFTHRPSSES